MSISNNQYTSNLPVVCELEDEDLLELVEMFIAELPERITVIEESINEKDYEMLATLAHQLKGAAGSYGFPTISEAAECIEKSAKMEDELGVMKLEISNLSDLCNRACIANPAI